MSHGKLEVITGCMFAGKTEELIRRLERSEIAGQEIEVFKPEIDDRYSEDAICSHKGSEWEAIKIPTGQEHLILDLRKGIDVIAIDEANFFTDDLVDVVQTLADEGYRVIVVGLDQTYRGEVFKPMGELMAISEEVTKLTAICEKCGEKATRPQRFIDGEPAPEDAPTVVVGEKEKYEARCRDCHEISD